MLECPGEPIGANPITDLHAMESIMTLLSTNQPALSTRALLRVHRSGIQFHNVSRDRVRITIEVENRGSARSQPARMHLESAPFGVFVPWQPLVTLTVPAIDPGASVRVETEALQPRPKPLADFRSALPPNLATSTAAGDERARRRANPMARAAVVDLLLRALAGHRELPADLHDFLEDEQPHWAGNLNVWLGREPVERHLAPRLRIHPGCANLAEFCLGRRPDAYAFRLEGLGSGWPHILCDLRSAKTVAWSEEAWREPAWNESTGMQIMLLVLRPPPHCERGLAEVHVLQRSSGKTAIVEFDLDPSASGPGCFRL